MLGIELATLAHEIVSLFLLASILSAAGAAIGFENVARQPAMRDPYHGAEHQHRQDDDAELFGQDIAEQKCECRDEDKQDRELADLDPDVESKERREEVV